MPFAPKRPCKAHGCAELTEARHCGKHATDATVTRPYDQWRGSAASRGYDATWTRVRRQALARDCYLCQICLAADVVTPATEVHHDVPIAVDPSRRLDMSNLISLCKPCHSRITATRDSSFSRGQK